jgi:hypothetical protein
MGFDYRLPIVNMSEARLEIDAGRFMGLADEHYAVPVRTEPDRRRNPRYTVNVQIEIRPEDSDVPMRVETTDLSRGGCYVEVMIPFLLSMRMEATLWLDGNPIVVRGVVVTRHPQYGNGIMFVEFRGSGELILAQYLEKAVAG